VRQKVSETHHALVSPTRTVHHTPSSPPPRPLQQNLLEKKTREKNEKTKLGLQGDGENIAYTSNLDQAVALAWAIKSWYDEVSLYNYASPGLSGATGHFTQVVWVGSARLGCAVRQCPTMSGGRPASFISCHYSPPGNYQGQFPQNVSALACFVVPGGVRADVVVLCA